MTLARQQYDNLWCEMPARLADMGVDEAKARRRIGRWLNVDRVPPGELKAMIEAAANAGGVRDPLAYVGAMVKRWKEKQ